MGPAEKQAPDFEYVAVAFKSQTRPKRSREQRARSKQGPETLQTIFGGGTDKGYRTLEVMSGDRRLLFEDSAKQGTGERPSTLTRSEEAPSTSGAESDSGPSPRSSRGVRRVKPKARPAKPASAQPGTISPDPHATSDTSLGGPALTSVAAAGPQGPQPARPPSGPGGPSTKPPAAKRTTAPSPEGATTPRAAGATARSTAAATAAPVAAIGAARKAAPPQRPGKAAKQRAARAPPPQAPPSSSLQAVGSAVLPTAKRPSPQATADPNRHGASRPSTTTAPAASTPSSHPSPSSSAPRPSTAPPRTSNRSPPSAARGSPHGNDAPRASAPAAPTSVSPSSPVPSSPSPAPSADAPSQPRRRAGRTEYGSRLARLSNRDAVRRLDGAACRLLCIDCRQLRSHRGLHVELMALQSRPEALTRIVETLQQRLGLALPQVVEVLVAQPRVLRLEPEVLAARGAAIAAALDIPPPPDDGGGLAAVVTAAPNALTLRTGYAAAPAALAAALGMPRRHAAELLRRAPQLLCHPPTFYARSVSTLLRHLEIPLPAAAALVVAEPSLLAVSPSVLETDCGLLRRKLQLRAAHLAAVVGAAPWLLARPPGSLSAPIHRLLTVLMHSAAWEPQLQRLLAGSPRNLAVALCFGSDRYERLEYLAASGRDGMMGFKQALSVEDEEFGDLFPEYAAWRREHGR